MLACLHVDALKNWKNRHYRTSSITRVSCVVADARPNVPLCVYAGGERAPTGDVCAAKARCCSCSLATTPLYLLATTARFLEIAPPDPHGSKVKITKRREEQLERERTTSVGGLSSSKRPLDSS